MGHGPATLAGMFIVALNAQLAIAIAVGGGLLIGIVYGIKRPLA